MHTPRTLPTPVPLLPPQCSVYPGCSGAGSVEGTSYKFLSPGSEGPGHWGACVFTVPRVRTMAPCPPFPHTPGALACQRKGTWKPSLPELLPSVPRWKEDADPCEPSLPGLRAQAELLSPGQGWASENAAFPRSTHLSSRPPLSSFSSSGSLLIGHCVHPGGSPEVGAFSLHPFGAWSACACLSPDTGAWLRAYPWLLLCCQFINSK